MAATNASSGSTCAGLDQGSGTTDGDDEAGKVSPPSKVQVCSREYLPFTKSGCVRCQFMIALCSAITSVWSSEFARGFWPRIRMACILLESKNPYSDGKP